jgi:hypothetical protein
LVLGKRDPTIVFLGATALISLVIVTKRLGMEYVFQAPILASITVNKFIAPFTISMALLSGKGVDLFGFAQRQY